MVAFETAEQARLFVLRVHLAFDEGIATFRDDCQVIVFDATLNGAQRRISELARNSTSFRVPAMPWRGR